MRDPSSSYGSGEARHTPHPTQAGAVPYRVRAGEVELFLITARSTGQWGFPKGNIDPGDTARETALKEAWEEAGVRGVLVAPISGYAYAKFGRAHEVEMFLLRVDEVLDDWPERGQRRRGWVRIDEARRRIDRAELIPVLESAVQHLVHDVDAGGVGASDAAGNAADVGDGTDGGDDADAGEDTDRGGDPDAGGDADADEARDAGTAQE